MRLPMVSWAHFIFSFRFLCLLSRTVKRFKGVSLSLVYHHRSRSSSRDFASGLLFQTAPTVGQPSLSGQSPQVARPFFKTHWRMGHSLSQNGVLTPSVRQPRQLIISGVMGTPFSSLQSFAVFSRSALSLFSVATRASQVSQSSPQQAIKFFMVFFLSSICASSRNTFR